MSIINLNHLIAIAQEAGQAILEIYQTDFTIENKEDDSPLTSADKASHAIIAKALKESYPVIPVLSEEGKGVAYEERKNWNRFWLVDPIDGTKEFIKRNGEFTVNIALIENGYPVLGVIYAPALGTLYVGQQGEGAYKVDDRGIKTELKVKALEESQYTIVESRSHPSPEVNEYLSKLEKRFTQIRRIEKGSSLKFCAVAEALADSYPRFGPTMEWDTAAGQAIVEAAGGKVVNLQGQRFSYNKESLLNDYFIALSHEVDTIN
ncbi:3'(2'),5'-bisphosphate nucleotidase CysQ [Ammoniphilus sp. 3BR4]|uniref:3'(2'),5'-bisphosphate nucleotidase CysQ n=1 Tax=Ammoniphilus sp. 3BR4 TaxID=3158265 RepID=UPI0034653826